VSATIDEVQQPDAQCRQRRAKSRDRRDARGRDARAHHVGHPDCGRARRGDEPFRFLCSLDDSGTSVTLTTDVEYLNLFGRLYFAVVKPFHRLIVKRTLGHAATRSPGRQPVGIEKVSMRLASIRAYTGPESRNVSHSAP